MQHEDIATGEELARRASMAIDNARLFREAERANHAKDHFLAALSHELRTPLTPALLLSESLLGPYRAIPTIKLCLGVPLTWECVECAGEGLPPQAEENVRMIHESVELEVQLIDDLLDLTKISRYLDTTLALMGNKILTCVCVVCGTGTSWSCTCKRWWRTSC